MGGHYQMDILDSNVPSYTTDYKNAKQMSSKKKSMKKKQVDFKHKFFN